jgi:hypothetical protein
MLMRVFGLVLLFFIGAVQALPQGDLEDLLGPELDEPVPFMDQTTHHTEQASTLPHTEHATSVLREPTAIYTTRLTASSSHLTPTPTSQLPTPGSEGNDKHSNILTPSTSTSKSTSKSTSTSQNTTISAWYPPPSSPPAGPARGHPADWHVIGIAVIVLSVVGAVILVIVFFDQWWGFLGDVCCGFRKKGRGCGREELVPDWERGSWEFKVEDNVPAYPSFGSPPTSQTQEGAATHAQPQGADMPVDQRPDQGTLFDGLTFPPVPVFSESTGTRGAPYESSGWCRKQPRRNSVVNGVTAYSPHHTLNRSDTRRYTASEDAYDGLASE